MKNHILTLLILAAMAGIQYSCTDIRGDGIDTVEFTGSQVPENTSYRNPVWNFDLTNASVFLSSGPYYALGEEKSWANGIRFAVPVLTSTDLMKWSLIEQGAAFIDRPSWAEGDITSVTGFFSKSLALYYLFYRIGDAGLGVGDALTPQGPYVDYGKFTDKEALGVSGISDAFTYALGSTFYLFFSVPEEGIYGAKLSIAKNVMPQVTGTPFKIAGPDYSGVLIRKKGNNYWLYSGNGGNIVMGKSSDIEGPYVDRSGVNLTESAGEIIVTPGEGFSVIGQVAGVQPDSQGDDWMLYTAIDDNIPNLPTGEPRYVLMLNRLPLGDDGWPSETIEARSGYFSPRFQN